MESFWSHHGACEIKTQLFLLNVLGRGSCTKPQGRTLHGLAPTCSQALVSYATLPITRRHPRAGHSLGSSPSVLGSRAAYVLGVSDCLCSFSLAGACFGLTFSYSWFHTLHYSKVQSVTCRVPAHTPLFPVCLPGPPQCLLVIRAKFRCLFLLQVPLSPPPSR